MSFYKTNKAEKQVKVERVQRSLENALKTSEQCVIETVLTELEKVGSNFDDVQHLIRPVLHETLLGVYRRNPKFITVAQYADIMTLSSPSGRMYKLAFARLMGCDFTEKEMGVVWDKLRYSGVSSDHLKMLLAKYLKTKKPNVAEIVRMFKNSCRFGHMFIPYTTEKMQTKTFAAVREYLNDSHKYKEFRSLVLK